MLSVTMTVHIKYINQDVKKSVTPHGDTSNEAYIISYEWVNRLRTMLYVRIAK